MNDARPTIAEQRRAFSALHREGCFVMPNPWDAGSARYLQSLGFKALATTSSGHAWSEGRRDGAADRGAVLAHLRAMVEATSLPVNADFENGFGADPDAVAQSVRMAIDTGVAGLSIEDGTGDGADPVFPLPEALTRLRAARAAIDAAGGDVLLVGRAENFIVGRPDLDDTVLRLKAYAEAGADCLYAPGIRSADEIRAVVTAVAPKPVNLLIGWQSEITLASAAALGVRRISVGGALARSAWGGLMRAAQALAEGRFDGFGDAASGQALNTLFAGSDEGGPADRRAGAAAKGRGD